MVITLGQPLDKPFNFLNCRRWVSGTTIGEVIRPLLPLYGGMIAALILVTKFPWLSLWLPGFFGF